MAFREPSLQTRGLASTSSAIVLLAGLCLACEETEGPFKEPVILGGKKVSAAQLNRGHEHYAYYCATCHGERGDGRGLMYAELGIAPRDFRLSAFKFGRAREMALPSDEALIRIIQQGLKGTVMIPRDIPDAACADIVQYIKTFAPEGEGWRDPHAVIAPIEVTPDPWTGATARARERGSVVYHGVAQCWACHPAYETRAEINRDRQAAGAAPIPISAFRSELSRSEVKTSAIYTRPVSTDPRCREDRDCPGSGAQVCQFGHCEWRGLMIPPDFLRDDLRSGSERRDLYEIIAAGIPGTAMPMWKGSIDEKDLWAVAIFIETLLAERGTPAAEQRRARVKAELEGAAE